MGLQPIFRGVQQKGRAGHGHPARPYWRGLQERHVYLPCQQAPVEGLSYLAAQHRCGCAQQDDIECFRLRLMEWCDGNLPMGSCKSRHPKSYIKNLTVNVARI